MRVFAAQSFSRQQANPGKGDAIFERLWNAKSNSKSAIAHGDEWRSLVGEAPFTEKLCALANKPGEAFHLRFIHERLVDDTRRIQRVRVITIGECCFDLSVQLFGEQRK